MKHFVLLILLFLVFIFAKTTKMKKAFPQDFNKIAPRFSAYPGDVKYLKDDHNYAQQSLPFLLRSKVRKNYGSVSPIYGSSLKEQNTRYDLEAQRQKGYYNVPHSNGFISVPSKVINQNNVAPVTGDLAFCNTHKKTIIVPHNPAIIPKHVKTPCVDCQEKVVTQTIRKINNIDIYNPVPVITHYDMPILHHIPVNQIVKKYIPVYYPVPVEHRINIPVRIPIKVPQRVLIPQAVPYGVKVPVPFPVKVEIPRYKDIEVKKNVYVKVPIYEHIPIYHQFAISRDIEQKTQRRIIRKPQPSPPQLPQNNNSDSDDDCEELNKQLDSFISRKKGNLRGHRF